MRSRPGLAVLTACVLVTIGCTPETGDAPVETSLTVDEAKSIAQEMEMTLAGFVPADEVSAVDQKPTGVLMSCTEEGSYQWSGQTKVVLNTDRTYDGAAVTEAIARAYDDRSSYRTETDLTTDGELRAHVIGSNGQGYLVALSVDKTFVQILSFSPCFVLPDGMWPGGQY
ncbi:hypothetical protein QE392_000667 [Microbacterium proteolyticum]|nr:hypothetical protein [Microbacterium sp. SORGH_AS_0344]MDQ1168863.1 hypothetical protein [Microbacterium proteolyticum]